MEQFDIQLKKAMTRANPMPAAEVAALNQGIVRAFARKQKAFWRFTAAYLMVMTLLLLLLLALLIYTPDLKQCLLYGICALIIFESTVLMKLWYWGMHSKIATLREIKVLQLAVADLKSRLSPAAAETSTAFAAEASLAPALAPARPASPKTRRVILPSIWLLAVVGTAYWGWLWSPGEPRDVTPFFEKTVAAADAVGNGEWEQTFKVTRAREHFYPRLVPAGKHARVWISVRPEGGDPIYTGPLEPGWKIGFGRPVPGRFVIKGRTEQADGGFALHLGGVDEIPGSQPLSRFFFLLLSLALFVGLPLLWLQNRWLRQIDPEIGTTAAGPPE